MFERILTATDFSGPATLAVERAARLAAEHRSRLLLLHVVPHNALQQPGDVRPDASPTDTERAALVEDAQARIARLAATVRGRHGVASETRIVHGRPAGCIAAAAGEAAGLLVIGACGADSPRDGAIGSTAQRLVRSSPCPVLLVRTPPTRPYRRVLAPVDFSASARRALKALAASFPAADLHVTHAFEHLHEGLMRYAAVDEQVIEAYTGLQRSRLARELPRWAQHAAGSARPLTFHLRHGHPHTVLDRLVGQLHPDLVALAAHGKSEVEKALLGSVSTHVAQSARTDVLLLRGRAFERPSKEPEPTAAAP
jgi:CPA2 family monovalent cation:H+ antiporter-2